MLIKKKYLFKKTVFLPGLFASAVACWSTAGFSQTGIVADSTTAENETGIINSIELPVDPEESHSRREADSDLLELASQYPEQFTGKTLMFKSGRAVGEILDIRRKLDNLYLYLIVDASPFFNSPTTYAIAVRDIESVNDEFVLMSMAEGMHLRGLPYYPDDYTNADNHFLEAGIQE